MPAADGAIEALKLAGNNTLGDDRATISVTGWQGVSMGREYLKSTSLSKAKAAGRVRQVFGKSQPSTDSHDRRVWSGLDARKLANTNFSPSSRLPPLRKGVIFVTILQLHCTSQR
jgi:hypothetical protein